MASGWLTVPSFVLYHDHWSVGGFSSHWFSSHLLRFVTRHIGFLTSVLSSAALGWLRTI